MPKMDGYEIAKILRSKDDMERSVLLMLSAHDGVLDKLRAKMVGANGFIAKPFRAPFLLETVLMYLNAGAVM
jgi:DNA-binding response OmpR family regulator